EQFPECPCTRRSRGTNVASAARRAHELRRFMKHSAGGGDGKVPAVTLGFWVIKIAATTLGETGGDALSMTLNLGYGLSTAIFAALFLLLVTAQIRSSRFIPSLYWAVIVATTTVGTTMADLADRSLGIGYTGGSLVLVALLMASLALWRRAVGT